MQVRRATMEDIYQMQHCNLRCLPENYNLRYYLYHILSWPQLLYVQEDHNRNVVGYVLAKMEDEEVEESSHGHITSIAVLRTHRRLGVASRVMRVSMNEMQKQYDAKYCSLHVRKTNDAALHLYQETLGFRCANVEEKYYIDEEDAYHMKKFFRASEPGFYVTKDRQLIRQQRAETSNKGTTEAMTRQNGAASLPPTSSSNGTQQAGKKGVMDVQREQLELVAELLEEDMKGTVKGRHQHKSGRHGKTKK